MGLDTQVLGRHLARRVGSHRGERSGLGDRELVFDDRAVDLG
jgi:hypothetical protein